MIRKRTSDEIRDDAMARFNELAGAKYDRGQEEHGGLLDQTVTLGKIEEELIDAWFYIQSLDVQTEKLTESMSIVIKGLQSRVFELKEELERVKLANVAAEKEIEQWKTVKGRLEDDLTEAIDHRTAMEKDMYAWRERAKKAEKELEHWKELAKR